MPATKHICVWALMVVFFPIVTLAQQPTGLSAAVTVIGNTVTIQRANTTTPLRLPDNAVTPIGAGDIVFTGANGRVVIDFLGTHQLYLLSNSELRLHDFSAIDDGYRVDAFASGIAIQRSVDDIDNWHYTLSTNIIDVTKPSNLFAVWALDDYLEAAISAEGTLEIRSVYWETPIEVPAQAGNYPLYGDEPIVLQAPLHAAQLLSFSIDCTGTVSTRGSEGLRLRQGAALDYLVAEVLQDGQQVRVIGTTENDLWFGIPYQTGIGWLFSSLVEADCQGLPVYPNLVGSQSEAINDVREAELDFLQPFYGLPEDNPVFYR